MGLGELGEKGSMEIDRPCAGLSLRFVRDVATPAPNPTFLRKVCPRQLLLQVKEPPSLAWIFAKQPLKVFKLLLLLLNISVLSRLPAKFLRRLW